MKMTLRSNLAKDLLSSHQEMLNNGRFPSQDRLAGYYATFRDRFGPQQLSKLDGEELLNTMHAHGNRHSLVYWLEFKNDEEFPAIFGSIAGGSALKFGVYQRREDGVWVTGSPQKQKELTTVQAIALARRHRDQLLQGAELLEKLPAGSDDPAYLQLQEEMNDIAPDVVDTAWGHKYFSLLFPNKLDDYHVEQYQRFHLIKLLQLPPEGNGRFVCAGRYVAVANELTMPLNHLTTLLNERNGRPHHYWRVGTKLGGNDSRWSLMRDNNCVAIGWPEVGDLSEITSSREGQETVRALLRTHYYPESPQVAGRKMREIYNFAVTMSDGDYVLPSDGARVLGIGRVVGEYTFDPGTDVPHRRPVKWLSLEEWSPTTYTEGLQTTVFELRQNLQTLVETENRVLNPITPPLPPPPRLDGIPGQIQAILARKKQAILYGPPGTGKTYWARLAAQELAARACYGRSFAELPAEQQASIVNGDNTTLPLVRVCTFHPAYGYEDFLEGYRPQTDDQQLGFVLRNGIFKQICAVARQNPRWHYYLIIDEINRGDIPRIFGELLTVLERDKRGQPILLPLSGESFTVPENLYLIGTMNTADRSIALLDTALRRRFGFIELMPDTTSLRETVVAKSIPLGPWLEALNSRILAYIGRDARNLQIGHAYLLENGRPITDFDRFARVVQEDIIPLLEEYCYEDYHALALILGEALVDTQRQRIRHELFGSGRQDALIAALLAPSPDLLASAQVVTTMPEESDLRPDSLDENPADEETNST